MVDIKPQAGGKLFVILDAGMTELMRPMLYGAYHRIEHAEAVDRSAEALATSSVRSAKRATRWDRPQLPRPEVGDLMAVFDTGALRRRHGLELQPAARCPRRSWCTAAGRSSSGVRRSTTCCALES